MRKSKKIVEPFINEPYRDHRWKVEAINGYSVPELLCYAACAQLPNYTRSNVKLPLILTFYDVSARGPDVLECLLNCTRAVGDTVISRHHGDGIPVTQWRFINSVIDELVMPKLDFSSSKISRIVLNISYDKVLYEKC